MQRGLAAPVDPLKCYEGWFSGEGEARCHYHIGVRPTVCSARCTGGCCAAASVWLVDARNIRVGHEASLRSAVLSGEGSALFFTFLFTGAVGRYFGFFQFYSAPEFIEYSLGRGVSSVDCLLFIGQILESASRSRATSGRGGGLAISSESVPVFKRWYAERVCERLRNFIKYSIQLSGGHPKQLRYLLD